jgi:hypothetical protein
LTGFAPFLGNEVRSALFFLLSYLALGLLACLAFLLFAGLTFRAQHAVAFCEVITQRDPLSIVQDLMQQSELVCRELRLNDRWRVGAFLSAAPSN